MSARGICSYLKRLRNLGSRSCLCTASLAGVFRLFRGCLAVLRTPESSDSKQRTENTNATSDSNNEPKTQTNSTSHTQSTTKNRGSAQSPAVARGYTTHGAERAQERGSPRHTPLLNLLDNAGPCQGAVRSGVALALGLMIGPPFSDPLRWEIELAVCDLGSFILRSGQLGPVAASSRRRLCARR